MTKGAVDLMSTWIRSSCETLSILLNERVYHESAKDSIFSQEQLQQMSWDGLAYPVALVAGLEGQFYILVEREDMGKLVSLLAGGDPEEISEAPSDDQLGLLQDTLEQLVGGFSHILTSMGSREVKLRLSKPQTRLPNDGGEQLSIAYQLKIEGVDGILLTLLIPKALADTLGKLQISATNPLENGSSSAASRKFSPVPASEDDTDGADENEDDAGEPLERTVQRIDKSCFDLVMGVPLRLQVVLGRTSVPIQEIIGLGEGSVVELDQDAGEPVELYVHGRLVGYGEVTVVGDKFAVRVLEIARRGQAPRLAQSA